MKEIQTLYWKNNKVFILDQLLLPHRIKYISCGQYSEVVSAIKRMNIRGAPAIGIAAAYGVLLAAKQRSGAALPVIKKVISQASKKLFETRPTAVNLCWALERMRKAGENIEGKQEFLQRLEHTAKKLHEDDIKINKKIGYYGAGLFKKRSTLLTHCNAGALATAGYGTALGVIRAANDKKKIKFVYVDETRPYLQGARLTAWELQRGAVPHALITDSMAGYYMGKGCVDAVIVGADRIARNGDVANKIGTYSLSILARYHKIPFYVAAPLSTVDLNTDSGKDIVIEERSQDEVLFINKKLIAPKGTKAKHPGFDVTPGVNITAIITEQGVFKPNEIKHLKS